MTQYEFYASDTLLGLRGKTAQFWMLYASIIEYCHILHHAIKCNDPAVFAYALFLISSHIFCHQSFQLCKIWMVLYALWLVNLETDTKKLLQDGAFSINRTGKNFAQVPVDMALEQTINADAKNCFKGIMKYANIASAVNRWPITNSMRSGVGKRFTRYS